MYRTTNLTMIGNSIAGSEKVGIHAPIVDCADDKSLSKIRDNEVTSYGILHFYKLKFLLLIIREAGFVALTSAILIVSDIKVEKTEGLTKHFFSSGFFDSFFFKHVKMQMPVV